MVSSGFFYMGSKKKVSKIMLYSKACMIVLKKRGSIWIKACPNLCMKFQKDSDSIIFRLLKLLRPYFYPTENMQSETNFLDSSQKSLIEFVGKR